MARYYYSNAISHVIREVLNHNGGPQFKAFTRRASDNLKQKFTGTKANLIIFDDIQEVNPAQSDEELRQLQKMWRHGMNYNAGFWRFNSRFNREWDFKPESWSWKTQMMGQFRLYRCSNQDHGEFTTAILFDLIEYLPLTNSIEEGYTIKHRKYISL